MNIKKLNEELSNLLQNTSEYNIALDVINHYLDDILDTLEERYNIKKDVAEYNGYKLYDDSLVIDVKRRPYIDNEQVLEYLNSDEGEYHYQEAIQEYL